MVDERIAPSCDDDSDPHSVTLETALERILSRLLPIDMQETVALESAVGRVLAHAIDAPGDVPPFRSAAMDGYAIRHAGGMRSRRLVGRSLAGHPSSDRVADDEAVRVTTGARVPDEADTVVMQEHVDVIDHRLDIRRLPDAGAHVRQPGSDTPAGHALSTAGTRIGSATVAMLATHGLERVSVRRRVRVAVLSTGDELVTAGEPLERGQIHDANAPLLAALLDDPAIAVERLGIVGDCADALDAALERTGEVDVIVSSGGVSVGEADHVRERIAALDDLHLWKVAMKPGRPLSFARLPDGRIWFGLPGNPVSAAVTCLMIVYPALDRLCGLSPRPIPWMRTTLQDTLTKRPGRVEFQRARLWSDGNGEWLSSAVGAQDSHRIASMHAADALIRLPAEANGAAAGDTVLAVPLQAFVRRPL